MNKVKHWHFRSVLLICILMLLNLSLMANHHAAHAATLLPRESNGTATTPLLGWSSWSTIRSNPTESNIEAQAQALSTTLKSHGYQYVNMDDFWYLNPSTTVDQYGRWAIDTNRFPHGISAVATYVHNLGLKFGFYLTPGIPIAAVNQNTPIEGTSYHARDIAVTSKYESNYNFGNVMYYIDYSKPGAQAFINSWANQLASWGVDFLKMDGVGDSDIPDIQAWSTALKQSGRTIYFHLSNSLDRNNVSTWQQYSNGWRIDGDVECYCSTLVNWNNVSYRFSDAPGWSTYAGSGGWNDLDSLDVGNGSKDGLTNDERQTYMTLWAASAAPLYTGDDLTSLDSFGVSLLTNDEVIAIDQAGRPAHPLSQSSSQQVWFANNYDGTYTVALFNLGGSSATVTVNWSSLGIAGSASVHDVWSHSDLGNFSQGFSTTLATHASRLLKVTAGSQLSSNGSGGTTLQAGSLPGSRLNIFGLGADGNVWDLYMTGDVNSAWSSWGSHGNPGVQLNKLTVGSFANGQLSLFATGSDGNVWNAYKQTPDPNSQWSGWSSLGHASNGFVGQVQVGMLPDGRPQIFVIGQDNTIWTAYKTGTDPNSAWSGWSSMGNPGVSINQLTVGTSADGRLNLFATGSDGNVWNAYKQTSDTNSQWSGWSSMGQGGNGLSGQVQVGILPDGRFQLFALGHDTNVWTDYKTSTDANSAWSGWSSMGNPGKQLSYLTVGAFSDGRLNLFATGSDGNVWNVYKQTTDPNSSWSGWSSFGQAGSGFASSVQVGFLADGRVILFVIDTNGTTWEKYKTTTDPNAVWSDWINLGQPSGSGGILTK
jgi:alpha-galactosidase